MKMPHMTASGHSGVSRAKVGLNEAKQYLTLPAGEDDSRIRRSMDAELLLAKLHFACGNETLTLESSASQTLRLTFARQLAGVLLAK